MLSVEQLTKLKDTPKEDDMSLQLLAEFYEKYISNRVYQLELEDGAILNFSAKNEHFAHLIGLHKFYDTNHSNNKLHKMSELKKMKGFDNLRNKEITIQDLKSVRGNNKKYKEYKKRILNFPFSYQLLRNSVFLSYDKSLVETNTKINGNYIFVGNINNNKLHFFFVDDINIPDYNTTVPITFIVRKINDFIFVRGQEKIKINKITIRDINTREILEVCNFLEADKSVIRQQVEVLDVAENNHEVILITEDGQARLSSQEVAFDKEK